MNIFVGNLSFRLDESEFRELFEGYGEVASAKIIMDRETGRSRGFGFVEMPNDTEGNAAIEGLNEAEVHGRNIRVNQAEERERRPRRPRF
jgi:RNA recognition motif-containing protein